MNKTLLTIAIPTYNRASFLSLLLDQLFSEVNGVGPNCDVEILISDNASSDSTQDIVANVARSGFEITYVRNNTNIGSDRNIAQCFNMALGRYVLIMGDDDLLVDGMLGGLLTNLKERSPGVALLRAYGFDEDFRSESPGTDGNWVTYHSVDAFLMRAGAQITLISACVINKQLIAPLDTNQFVDSSLVQVHLVLRALLASSSSISYEGHAIACKRNNSGGYSYAQVFVENLGAILDFYQSYGLSLKVISKYESNLLRSHHPYYLWRIIRSDYRQLSLSEKYFVARFRSRWEYNFLIKPMFSLPRPLAWVWGAVIVLVGRLAVRGGIRRGIVFLKSQLRIRLGRLSSVLTH